jgi:ATP-binding cassette subfamily G (WHITE) protein 8 (sterolin 2)
MCHCKHVRVGDENMKGISGGERRRLSLAVQLLGDPSTLLLDEPTTGLDAFTARHVVATLKTLSSQGRTVIVSIHQPRYVR